MAALTSDRDTVRRLGEDFSFEAATTIYAGAMVCLDASGKAAPASITAGLGPVVGVAQRMALTGEKVDVSRGVYSFDALSGDEPGLPEVGGECFAADDCTVQKTTAANAPVAGIVYDINEFGVWVKI